MIYLGLLQRWSLFLDRYNSLSFGRLFSFLEIVLFLSYRIYLDDVDISVYLRLSKIYTVYQMEMYALNVTAKEISQFYFCTLAVKALNLNVVKSKWFYDGRHSMNLINHDQLKLIWVPGDSGIENNENIEECAVIGLSSEETIAYTDI